MDISHFILDSDSVIYLSRIYFCFLKSGSEIIFCYEGIFFMTFDFKNGCFNEFNRYRRGLETFPQAKTLQKWTRYFLLFFPTRPSDEYDSGLSRKYSRPLLDIFACIG